MEQINFSELDILPEIKRAIDEMGFDTATNIQAQAIPLIMTGVDVIGKSQTGTGKTVAFGIPALTAIDTDTDKPTLQAMIICPTRELAQQACVEIKKLSKYMKGIHPVEVYGGVPMDRQILRLKKANIVIGTPGRIMDHMRRRTIKVQQLKMIVLDEADEMLSMGFKEDIETILTDTPETRQTILFSATMPKSILNITAEFQKDPQMIQIDAQRVTLDNIKQYFLNAPSGSKLDTLNLLIRYHQPKLCMIFCNTKHMTDEVADFLCQKDFSAEALHGDMKQMQRTKVMDGFKSGKTDILVATDVAARGIDVTGIDYVINFDIPQNNEYYVHRIGRTGRAGKDGTAITICSGKRQIYTMRDIARMVKSEISELEIPTVSDIKSKSKESYAEAVEKTISDGVQDMYYSLVEELVAKGFTERQIAAAALELQFGLQDKTIVEVQRKGRKPGSISGEKQPTGGFKEMSISIGRASRVAPNHVVGAITERTDLDGAEIGKITIYEDYTTVGIPADRLLDIVDAMEGCKICGKPTVTVACQEKNDKSSRPHSNYRRPSRGDGFKKSSSGDRKPHFNSSSAKRQG